MSEIAKKVETLVEAMPYLQKYAGKVVVIKYGGNAMINEELKNAVLHDVVLLKLLGLKPVLSHGGGPGIKKMHEKLEIPVKFINGLRYTCKGGSDDQACRRFTTASAGTARIILPAGRSRTNITRVEAISVGW